MKILFLSFTLLFFFTPNDTLTGRWESRPSEKGNVTGVFFKPDHSLEGYVNKKPFTTGTYDFDPKDSIISFVDNGCNGVRAVYKILFFSNSDSLRFRAISDSCTERKNGMERLILGRVK
jgi:hypothetical protein